MHYQITDIAEITGGKLLHRADAISPQPIEHLLIDSRKIIYPESSLFFAIKGERNNGMQYIKDVYDAGVRSFIVESNHDLSLPADVNVIVVENVLMALQTLAAYHRKLFTYPVVGITGSNGKTIVKEWLNQLLKNDIHLVRSPKSYNSQVGVPLSVWQMQETHQLGIFEAGISLKNEMLHLQKMILPTIGIFTNLGVAHDEGFHSKKEKLHEKLQLFRDTELLIYNADQTEVEEGIKQFLPRHPKLKTVSWSKENKPADIQFEVERKSGTSILKMRKGAQILGVHIPFSDEASIDNACTCFAFLLVINRISTDVLSRFEELQAVEMRLQLKEAINNCVLINDSYNADFQALQIALDFLQQQSAGYSKTVILSDILQSGMVEAELYAGIARLLKQKEIIKLYGVGPQFFKYQSLFPDHSEFFKTTDDFIASFKSSEFHNRVILLKGARTFQFEKISALLEKRVHETVFEINLNALVHNLNYYRNKLHPDVKIMGMVKAFSYGAGSYEIAKVLAFHRADYLTVAYADEGVTLRRAGIQLPIMVMNPEESGFDAILRHNLEPEIYSMQLLHKLLHAVNGEEISIHIELDTGMKRLGFEEEELDTLIGILQNNRHVRIKSVFTHLAASEEKKHDEFTQSQISRFKKMAALFSNTFNYPILNHALNSAGIARFKDAQLDMVRLGIGLYGIDPAGKVQKDLQQIGTLKTVISQLRKVKAHETIGYSRRGTVNQDSIIATAAIGYADGLNRKLGNGKGYMVINGQRAPIVGSICMDMTMLDVTHIACKEGDEVIVFGKDPNILDIADKIGTIPYEVLTSISQRVRRVYYYE